MEDTRLLVENEDFAEDESSIDAFLVKVTDSSSSSGYRSADYNESLSEDTDHDLKTGTPSYKLFAFASRSDLIKYSIGCVSALLTSFCYPLSNWVFGRLTTVMVDHAAKLNATTSICDSPPLNGPTSILMSQAKFTLYAGVVLALAQFVFGFSMVYTFNVVAANMVIMSDHYGYGVYKIRTQYFQSLICQNVGWFDTNSKMDLPTRLIEDVGKIQEALNEKTAFCLHSIFSTIIFLVLCFHAGWELATLLSFAVVPTAILTFLRSVISNNLTKKEQEAYAEAGGIVEEAITNIRTIAAFCGEEKESNRFETSLAKVKKFLTRKAILLGLMSGLDYFIYYTNFSIGFWYGTKLLLESRERGDNLYDPGVLVVIYFSTQSIGFNIGQSAEHFKTFGQGFGASRAILKVLKRISDIDPFSKSGEAPQRRAQGEIEFDMVEFSYPSRPDVQILKNISFKIRSGQTIAFVGHSGCGKSTAIQLLQRFYDPISGKIKLDGVNIKDLNIRWLRSQMGVVCQEPVLFNCSIGQNIAMGCERTTDSEVKQAAIQANAHNFICRLPKGYDTIAGERGAMLSGGQKQRIAIARALVRNPPILLLDEATSALDTQSEAIVQAALERARHGRTTIIVAHRLSTIKAADVIIAIRDGQVAEIGTHEELMTKKQMYYQLVSNQAHQIGTSEDIQILSTFTDDIGPAPMENGLDMNMNVQSLGKKTLDEFEESKVLLKSFKLMRLIKMTSKEWPYTILTVLSTLVKGIYFPVFAFAFGNFLGSFTSSDNAYIQEQGNFYALVFVLLATVVGFASFFQHYFNTKSGDAFTLRMRKSIFRTLLRQDMTFFNESENTVGNLCARLSTDATSIHGATGDRLVNLLQTVTIVVLSAALGLYSLPKMGLVCSIFIPISLASSFVEGKFLGDDNVMEKVFVENAVNIGVEAVNNIKLVASFGLETFFIDAYTRELEKSNRINRQRAKLRALAYGIAMSFPFVAVGLSMWYGAYLVEQECAYVADVFKVSEALVYGITCADAFLLFAPDYEMGKLAGARIFKLLDRKPLIDSNQRGEQVVEPEGSFKLNNTSFNYLSRPTTVLKNVNMSINPGDKVALVGPSGSGKSSLVSLLLRFYDPQSGRISFDDYNYKNLNLNYLRAQLALVSQEPILFDYSIADNIAYGDNSRKVDITEIMDVARLANVHEFITSLPAGYDTRVGALGSQLSGGQKQRVCIARALIRNPKLLILDEATSALDTENEALVQEALDKVQNSRTSITVAHRLTSIQNSSQIFVLKDGVVVEQGTHQQLLDTKGVYKDMWCSQLYGSAKRL